MDNIYIYIFVLGLWTRFTKLQTVRINTKMCFLTYSFRVLNFQIHTGTIVHIIQFLNIQPSMFMQMNISILINLLFRVSRKTWKSGEVEIVFVKK